MAASRLTSNRVGHELLSPSYTQLLFQNISLIASLCKKCSQFYIVLQMHVWQPQ